MAENNTGQVQSGAAEAVAPLIRPELFKVAERWKKGISPTEADLDLVYNEFPDLLDMLGHFMNGLANIADTNVSSSQLRHMAGRYLGRAPAQD